MTEVTMDELGRPVSMTGTGRPVTEWAYDGRGRVISVKQTANGKSREQTYRYNDGGWVEYFTDALGEETKYSRDVVGRLETLKEPDGATTKWKSNNADSIETYTPPNAKSYGFAYDSKTQVLLSEDAPEIGESSAGDVSFSYSAANQLQRISRADGRTIDFSYYDWGGLKAQKLGSATITFNYDKGYISRINRSDGVIVNLTRDGARLTGSSWSGAITGKVTVSHNEDFWPSTITVNDASSVTYTYDDDGLVTGATATAGLISWTRDANTGAVTSSNVGNTSMTYSYSGFAELSAINATVSGAPLFTQNIVERDKLGRISHLTETGPDTSHDVFYSYDLGGRLKTETRDGIKTTCDYDINGNRTSVQVGTSVAVAASFDAQDRIQTYGNQTYAFDKHGDMKSRSGEGKTLTLTYDELGNLMKAVGTDGTATTTIEYVVDGLGRRVARRVNGQFDRAWLYRDSLRPVSEVDSNGIFTHFVYDSNNPESGAPDALIRAGVFYRVVKDHLGSVRLVVNAKTGDVAQSIDYDAWGNVLSETGAGFQPFGFAGGLYDATTNLVRFGARDYDPATGRWTAKDVIGFAGGQGNLYLYVNGEPVNRVDPTGLRILPSDFIGPLLPGDQRGLTCEQQTALRTVVAREKHFGTGKAAGMSSITWGDHLIESFNSSDGNSVPTKYGDMDLDWFTDVRATSPLERLTVLPLYFYGKLAWTIGRKFHNIPIGNALPFTDPTERVAVWGLLAGVSFGELFNEEFFRVYGTNNRCH